MGGVRLSCVHLVPKPSSHTGGEKSVTVVQETPPMQEGQRFCSEAQIAGIIVSQLRRESEGRQISNFSQTHQPWDSPTGLA